MEAIKVGLTVTVVGGLILAAILFVINRLYKFLREGGAQKAAPNQTQITIKSEIIVQLQVNLEQLSPRSFGEKSKSLAETHESPSSQTDRSLSAKLIPSSGLPHIWNVPMNRSPNFTGRDYLLNHLRKALQSGHAVALTQAITGLGGVGKTQLALEYSYRHASEYGIVWWVRAEEPAKLAADYAALAQPLDLPEKDAHELEVIGKAVWEWLGQNTGWLLVFDNAPSPEDVTRYFPHGTGGHVIVTSRDPNWRGVAGALPVQVMEPDEARKFLLKRTGETDEEAAAELAKELGYLPLALEQAGAYIEATGRSLSDYLQLYRKQARGHQGKTNV